MVQEATDRRHDVQGHRLLILDIAEWNIPSEAATRLLFRSVRLAPWDPSCHDLLFHR
jgi:hypothetical protein